MSAGHRVEHFRRLGGWAGRVLPGGRLFRTDEYLLLVRHLGLTESYRRLYFRDLQGIQVLVTNRRAHLNLGLGVFAGVVFLVQAGLLGAAIGLRVSELYPVILSLTVPLALLLLLLVGNTLLGTGCQCLAHSAVQTVTLPGIARLRHAEALLAELEPLVARAQGTLPPDVFAQRLTAAWDRAANARGPTRRSAVATGEAAAPRPAAPGGEPAAASPATPGAEPTAAAAASPATPGAEPTAAAAASSAPPASEATGPAAVSPVTNAPPSSAPATRAEPWS